MTMPKLTWVEDAASADAGSAFDAVVVVLPEPSVPEIPRVDRALQAIAAVDARVGRQVVLVPAPELAGGRLVISPTGSLDRDGDDVRRYAEAARDGVRRARDAGSRRPLLLVPHRTDQPHYSHCGEVAALGALSGLWEPLEAREALGESRAEPVEELGVWTGFPVPSSNPGHVLAAMSAGRRIARDVTGTDPERMAPLRVAELCAQTFAGLPVAVTVIDDPAELDKKYPLLMAVARASMPIERHRPCVVRLEYRPVGDVQETLLLAGKGVTYDTGGADLKTDGHMAGMSRDKGGAGAVIGLLRAVAALQPSSIRVVAELGLVRNSIGADAYVTDEIIRAHSGKRIRIGNTDAEGRLVLADLLSHLREDALEAVHPRIISVATLTGHAGIAVGPYSIAIDNGPALRDEIARTLAHSAELWGEPFEQSRLRREDFEMVRPRTLADDLLSSNGLPSSRTPRGHQFPFAFLIEASGLADHGRHAPHAIAFTHIDLGGSGCEGGDWQHGRPTGAPVVALTARFALNR